MRWRVGAKMKMANEDIIEQQFRSDTLCEYEWPEKVMDPQMFSTLEGWKSALSRQVAASIPLMCNLLN